MAKPEQIINKLEPCGCGCHGSDPWHKSTYKRVVREVAALADGGQEGVVVLPFSTQPVRVTRDSYGVVETCRGERELFGAWVVDRGSIVWDK